MKLILVEVIVHFLKEFKDDALELWFEIKNENKFWAAPAAFYSFRKYDVEQEVLELNFVDESTGEVTFLLVSKRMHKAMVKYNLYPEFISNALKPNV